MIRTHKRGLILSSIAILLPMLVGLILWNRLPDQMITHFGGDRVPDGTSGKAFSVFGLPLILLALHWLCVFITTKDPKNSGQNPKLLSLVFWIMPIIGWLVCGMVYAFSLGYTLKVSNWMFLLFGLMFLVMGNYLPKCKQNYTMGIKICWTYSSEENWNATHRMAGKLWVACGVLLIIGMFLPTAAFLWFMGIIIVLAIVIPMVYSWRFYHRQLSRGEIEPISKQMKAQPLWARILAWVLVVVCLTFAAVVSFTGNIEVSFREDCFYVDASYYRGLTVGYEEIDSVVLESEDAGQRTNGFGSPRLSLGHFENEAYGAYLRYCYTQNPLTIVITSGDNTLALNAKNADETHALYEAILEQLP
ncbi:MAG: DUF1648 domain-containing protein [Ruminococcaceae bacterium]|nr:DUF1648 domain-containing protein [Oscillospiraceae bacterium]